MSENCADSKAACFEGFCVAADGDEEASNEVSAEGERRRKNPAIRQRNWMTRCDRLRIRRSTEEERLSGNGCAADGFCLRGFGGISVSVNSA
jgi:hypothetical protein